ncbi:MAG TPA: polyprenyl synthetase family protein [Thermomonospora sp.]|nr:polyprenyl synthetase family protein [Thermomonospora sp.]
MTPSMARIVSYHFGWQDERGRPCAEPAGKVVRPALVLLSAQAVGGDAADAVAAAVAVELVHNFSLLHDDVIDRDRTRRGRPAAWTVFGVPDAILAGDAMLAAAHGVLAGARAPAPAAGTWLAESVVRMCEGQSADVAFEGRGQVELVECLGMADAKTGTLLATACRLGGLLGGGEGEQLGRLERFGRALGLAFQLTDDVLGIWGRPDATGKPLMSDLVAGKKSLPVVAALCSSAPAGRELAAFYQRRATARPDAADLGRMARLVEEAGGRAWAELAARTAARDAVGCLEGLRSPAARELAVLAEFVTGRDH